MRKRHLQSVIGILVVGVIGLSSYWAAVAQSRAAGPPPPLAVDRVEGVRGAVRVNRPAGPPRVDLGITNWRGEAVTANCSTCHATREPNRATKSAAELDEFHVGLTYAHGSLSCVACHSADNYDALQLASGEEIAFVDVMTLCSQCHGPQRRDYDNGAHGGMTGYWDLSRGDRVRNNCIDCHDPHAPAFPMMQPTFKPRDRFLKRHEHSESPAHE